MKNNHKVKKFLIDTVFILVVILLIISLEGIIEGQGIERILSGIVATAFAFTAVGIYQREYQNKNEIEKEDDSDADL